MPDQYRELTEEGFESSEKASEKTSSVEQEILELEKKIAEKKAALQPEKEKALEQVLKQEKAAGAAVPGVSQVIQPSSSQAVSGAKEEAEKLRGFEKNQQLKALVDLAFEKGVYYATEVVKNLDNPYLLDEFHDVLVDELHKKLVERGKLEEI